MNSTDIQTLKEVLEAAAERFRDRPAFSFVGGQSLTFSEFAERVAGVQTLLRNQGIRPGDKVAIIGENMPNWGAAYFAVTTMGAIIVPILQEFHETAVHHIIRHSEAKAAFASRRFLHKVEEGNLPDLETLFVLDDFSIPGSEEPETTFGEAVAAAREQMNKWGEAARKLMDRGKPFEISPDDVAAILYTSGTTGHSKGVILTHRNIVSNALAGQSMVDIRDDDRMLSVLPMAHTYECTLGLVLPVLCGVAVYYLQKPPSPRTLLPAMAEIKPTFLLIVPLIIEKIYRNRIRPKLSGKGLVGSIMRLGAARKKLFQVAGRKLLDAFGGELRCMCIGGAALSPEVEEFLAEAGMPYAIGYGMTEAAPMLAGIGPGRQKLRSCGPPVPGVQLMLENPDPKTGEGEILAKGPNIMQGYYKAPKDTEDTFTEDGWLKTGDLGYFDQDGYCFIRGRIKNVIIGPSGENIYPEEVESVINACDYVLESLVFSRENQLFARVHLNYDALDEAFGVGKMIESKVREKVQSMLEDIRKRVNKKVSSFARVQRIMEQAEPFEKTPTQKIKRFLYLDKHDTER
ncbi:AMP-binding protein [Pseudodesulfovibrio tunisiensis]|uniref:AMP-binding protein n=1 Tax=Pseudodesulfovibrio tunisiensis TaxID=463192 RepID=UPI001FB56082|nr:AMP-binding protein [Pseudodesulfovibrio tunisiensis]